MAKNQIGPWGITRDEFQDDEDQYPQQEEIKRIRMIDWIYACKQAIVTAFFCIPWFIIGGLLDDAMHAPKFVSMAVLLLIPLTILATPITLVVNLIGFVFDPAKNVLTYPAFIFRRSIPISEIRNANSETTTTRHTYDPGQYARLAGDFGAKQARTTVHRNHTVNLSGNFGVRIMRFGARYKRDQFLSILQMVAPQCRITRAPWY